jgi:hypothetical protein
MMTIARPLFSNLTVTNSYFIIRNPFLTYFVEKGADTVLHNEVAE